MPSYKTHFILFMACPTSRDPSPTPEDADLEEVLMGYLNISLAPFTNLVAFKRICLARSKRLVEGTQTPQYLAFTSVSQKSLDEKIGLVRRDGVGYHE